MRVTLFVIGRQRQPLFQYSRSSGVATQFLKLVALMSFGPPPRMA